MMGREMNDPPPPCSIEGCQSESKCRSYCTSHYGKLYREGQLVIRVPLELTFRQCELCETVYTPSYPAQKYCGFSCGSTSRNPSHRAPRACLGCHAFFKPTRGGSNGKAKFCSRECSNTGRTTAWAYGPPLYKTCEAEYCEEPFVANGSRKKYHDKKCARKEKKRKDGRRSGSAIPILKLIEVEHNICYLCGELCGPLVGSTDVGWKQAPTREHVIPRSKGGTDTWDNVRLAHVSCNSKKHTRLLAS